MLIDRRELLCRFVQDPSVEFKYDPGCIGGDAQDQQGQVGQVSVDVAEKWTF